MSACAVAFLIVPPMWRHGNADERSKLPWLVSAILVPGLAIGLYAAIGSPRAADAGVDPSAATARPAVSPSRQDGIASVASLIDGLVARLEREPDDAGGWLLLAKSYRHLERRGDARAAYERASVLGQGDADLEAWLSDVDESAAGVSISGRVSIADARLAELDGSETVFIVARAAAGSPVPLAVLRTTAAELPYEFRMTDADSMMAGNDLSSAGSVIVTAKLSAEGDALKTLPGFNVASESFSTAEPPYLNLELGSE